MQDYGSDVIWQPGETAAFLIYNRLCREQAQAAFAASVAGRAFAVAPAAALADRARQQAAA